VDLDRVGSYSFHYECYNKRGMAARMVTRTIVVYGDARDAAFSATPAPTPAADWQVDGAAERLHADELPRQRGGPPPRRAARAARGGGARRGDLARDAGRRLQLGPPPAAGTAAGRRKQQCRQPPQPPRAAPRAGAPTAAWRRRRTALCHRRCRRCRPPGRRRPHLAGHERLGQGRGRRARGAMFSNFFGKAPKGSGGAVGAALPWVTSTTSISPSPRT
jgi:hypothetical protein